MEKQELKVLFVDRLLRAEEKRIMSFLDGCKTRGYDMVVLFLTKSPFRIEVIYFSLDFMADIQSLFGAYEFYRHTDPAFHFGLTGVDETMFNGILSEKFEVKKFYLTAGLKNVKNDIKNKEYQNN